MSTRQRILFGIMLLLAAGSLCRESGGAENAGIVKTGDSLTFTARQLVPAAGIRLVPDAAAPGGEAIESLAAAEPRQGALITQLTIPSVPAGRYRIAVHAAITKRLSAQHVAQIILSDSTGEEAWRETILVDTTDFSKEGVYREFSRETVQPPVSNGCLPFTVWIRHESAAVPLRIAGIELKALAITPVLIHKVWPEKLLARCRADQPIAVSVCNITGASQNGLKLRLELVHDAGATNLVGEKDLALQPFQSTEVVFPWNTGDNEYGHEARATVLDAQGKPLSVLSDYFSVSRSRYKLLINYWPWRDLYSTSIENDEQYIKLMRKHYGNGYEYYSFPPCNLVEVNPRHRFWTSGQNSVSIYDREIVKTNQALMHRLGIWAAVYNSAICVGWPGQEFARQYPELCAFDKKGRPQGQIDTAYWQTKENAYSDKGFPVKMPYKCEFPNNAYIWPVSDELMFRAADEIIQLHKELGIDAIRWDGHPSVWVNDNAGGVLGTSFGAMIYNYDGKKVTDMIPGGDIDRQSLHNIKLIKERVRQAVPDFEWGYNSGYELTVEEQPLTFDEICRDACIWVEGGFGGAVACEGVPNNTWVKFMEKLSLSAQLVLRHGGYPVHGGFAANSVVIRKYLKLLSWTQGSHPFIYQRGESYDYTRFATRYSQYLFDSRLRPLLQPDPDVHVTGWAEWKDRNADKARTLASELKIESSRPLLSPEKLLFTRNLDAGRSDTVFHMVNIPVKPYLDTGELDYPPVQENLAVSLRVPAGMKAREAWCLSPEGMPMETRLDIKPAEAGWVKVTVPRLALWNIVVLSWIKE